MTGQTLIQKILSRAAGKEKEGVAENEIVFVSPHMILSHDNSAAISKTFHQITGSDGKVWDPNRIFIDLDHAVPPPDYKKAENHKIIREFVKKQGIKHFYDCGTGICHQVLPEEGLVPPNVVILGSDSHTTTHGAFGAAGIPIGRTETASVWAIGETWLKVPETIKITLENYLPNDVYAKDVILDIIGKISADGATYKSIEFYGKAVERMSISDRMTISNMSAEAGAKAGIFPVDNVTNDWNKQFNISYDRLAADEDASYEQELNFDLASLTPRVAQPHKVDNVVPIEDLPRIKIDVALLGTCTNGRIEDLRIASEILKDKKINPNTRLLIYPASRSTLNQAIKEGIMENLVDAEGQIGVPACGPCLGEYGGTLAPGEKAISTANRNFKGRMGTRDAEIYLANPAVVAKSAIAGYITNEEV
ncbi:MAG: 3-isopropylmalate dehydratase large subunit [Candidatus Heimdallarchaeota archaeon]|nr:MAG: 3-isopropylmalate dehydratase large subunit [Candidatus Heimdallarchaeota archaeon]